VAVAIVIAPRAERALAVIEERWNREHGPGHPNPLLTQLLHLISLLSETPEIGAVFRQGARLPTWRRWLLRAGWHVYYTYDPARELVAIEAIWSARRRRGPRR